MVYGDGGPESDCKLGILGWKNRKRLIDRYIHMDFRLYMIFVHPREHPHKLLRTEEAQMVYYDYGGPESDCQMGILG